MSFTSFTAQTIPLAAWIKASAVLPHLRFKASESIRELTGTDRHWQALTGTDRHWQALTGTDRHWQALTGTDRHWEALTGTYVNRVTCVSPYLAKYGQACKRGSRHDHARFSSHFLSPKSLTHWCAEGAFPKPVLQLDTALMHFQLCSVTMDHGCITFHRQICNCNNLKEWYANEWRTNRHIKNGINSAASASMQQYATHFQIHRGRNKSREQKNPLNNVNAEPKAGRKETRQNIRPNVHMFIQCPYCM